MDKNEIIKLYNLDSFESDFLFRVSDYSSNKNILCKLGKHKTEFTTTLRGSTISFSICSRCKRYYKIVHYIPLSDGAFRKVRSERI